MLDISLESSGSTLTNSFKILACLWIRGMICCNLVRVRVFILGYLAAFILQHLFWVIIRMNIDATKKYGNWEKCPIKINLEMYKTVASPIKLIFRISGK